MYLEFVIGLINKNDFVTISCDNEEIEGIVVKIDATAIAVKKEDGSIIIKKDNDIKNITKRPEKVTTIAISPLSTGGQINKNSTIESSNLTKNNPRCGMILIKNEKSVSFHCSICGKDKVSKKYAIEVGNPDIRICNSCYGWTLARLEKK